MRGINRLRHYADKTRLLFGTMSQLQNWKSLREKARRARRGESVTERPVLHFRNGLKITMVPCSYAGWDFLFREICLEHCYRPAADFIPQKGWNVIDLAETWGFSSARPLIQPRRIVRDNLDF